MHAPCSHHARTMSMFHVHVPCPCPCSMSMSMSMPMPMSMSMSMSMFHVPCPCPCPCPCSMFHAHAHAHAHVHVPQVWEPLAAGSESLERDETQQDEIPSPVIELFELDAADVGLTLQPYGLGRQAVTIGVHPATLCTHRWSSSLAAARRKLVGPSSRPTWARARQATGATCRLVVSSSRPSRR
jgi:hypothetical protein